MTQTFDTPSDLIPMTAMATWSPTSGVSLRYFPLYSVDTAREEYGDGLQAADAFVQTTACNVCGMANEDIHLLVIPRACRSCDTAGCMCMIFEDPHAPGSFYCTDCTDHCRCQECDPDD